jgi:hypothetical protein
MIPYSYLIGTGQDHDGRYIECLEARLHQLLRPLLKEVDVDEDWYRAFNPDVDKAIAEGIFSSAREHYVTAGYFEDRLPRPIVVDPIWYLKSYPDVAEAIRMGKFTSAQQHFEESGFREGRLASVEWSLRADSLDKVRKMGR